MEIHHSAKNSLEFIENVKTDLFPDEVYVFTPKGTIIELPARATPVDFAYAIHSDIGNTCVAARLDRRLAPLSTPLESGLQVEIVTAPGARPNPAWLNFVVTGKAKSNIKHFLKKQHREESIDLGRRLIEKALYSFDLHLSDIPQLQLEEVSTHLQLDSIADLYEEVGLGNRMPLLVAKQIAKTTGLTSHTDAQSQSASPPLNIKGTEGLVVSYGKCCRPIPGDHIVGLIKAGHGVEVHVDHCPTLEKYQSEPDKQVALRWEDSIESEFSVDLRIDILNQRGSLADLALSISNAESNIENIQAEELEESFFVVNITISVRNRRHLARVLRSIRNSKRVIRIMRHRPHTHRV